MGNPLSREVLETTAEGHGLADKVGLDGGIGDDFQAQLTIPGHQLGRSRVHHLPGQLNVEADWLSTAHDRPEQMPAKLKGIKIHRFDGDSRRRSDLPPPGVAPRLWGSENNSVLRAFEHL